MKRSQEPEAKLSPVNTCSRCGDGTEVFIKHSDVILCNDCCMDLVKKLISTSAINAYALKQFATQGNK